MSDLVPDLETMRKAITLATRAPSVHNTQPWRWLVGDGSIHLYADWSRHVPVTDPDGRDLIVSCGAALHHLRVALSALGWTTIVRRLPDPADNTHLASIETRPQEPTVDDIWLARTIPRRRTDRRRYSSWPVPPGHLEELANAAAGEGGLAVPVTDPAARFRIAGAIAQAAIVQESNPDYRVEMAIWSGRGRGGDDGILAAAIPEPGAVTSELRQRTFACGTLTQAAPKRYTSEVSSLVVIATSSDDLLSRLRAGEATSAALLHATKLGIAACPMSQPLEIADTRRAIQDDVLHGSAVPQLLLRLGWAPPSADPLPQSPRRDLDDVVGELSQ